MPTTDVFWAQPQSLSPEELAALEAVLDDAERARARRIDTIADRNAFIAAHGMLRLALSAHTGRPPQAWRFSASAAGKPELTGEHAAPGVAFNLSHARALGAGLNQPPASVECSLTPVRIVRQHAGGPPLLAASYRPRADTVLSLARPAADRDVYPVVLRELFARGRALRSAINSP